MAKVLSVNVTAMIHEGKWTGSVGRTGIDKRSVAGRVRFENNGVAGDSVLDTDVHGGYDKAVYAYAREDAIYWEGRVGHTVNHGAFGENLTTEGIDLNGAVIGERWKIGSVILEVSEPRIPCRVFAGFWQRPTLIRDFTDAKRSGTYLRIIQEGEIEAGDEITLVSKPEHGVTILDIFEAKAGERAKIEHLKKASELSDKYKEWLAKIS